MERSEQNDSRKMILALQTCNTQWILYFNKYVYNEQFN